MSLSRFAVNDPMIRILTFDIEEWFHILDNAETRTESEWAGFEMRLPANTDRILQLLADTGRRATFFCLGWVARQFPSVVKRISDAGYEIGTHSDLHQLAYEQSPAEFASDLRHSLDSIEGLTGKKVRAYRAPGFSLKAENIWVFDVLMDCEIEIDCSIFPAARAHGGFANFGSAEPCWVEAGGRRMKEFPINVAKVLGRPMVFSGGGYFRLLPYPVIRRLIRRSGYAMTYFHPRDFDPGQPVVPGLGRVRRFKSYHGLQGCLGKLRRLLTDFEFSDLSDADARVDWNTAPIRCLEGTGVVG